MSVRLFVHIFCLLSMKCDMGVEVDEESTTVIFSHKVKVKVTGAQICQIWPHVKSLGSDRVNGSG